MIDNNYINQRYPHPELTSKIIKCAIEVHNNLGNVFQKTIYQRAMEIEFEKHCIDFESEIEMPLIYKGEKIGTRTFSFFVEGKAMVDIITVIQLEEVHLTQTFKHMDSHNMDVGILINFGSRNLDFKRIVNKKSKSSKNQVNMSSTVSWQGWKSR